MRSLQLFSILFFLSFSFSAVSQTVVTIAQARNLPVGQANVSIRGIITCGPELGQARYIQDTTAGFGIFFTTPQQAANVLRGDSVIITGTIATFNNLRQLSPVTNVTLLARNLPLPAPVVFTGAAISNAFNEEYEGRLVRLNEVASVRTTSNQPFPLFSGNTNYNLNQNPALQLRVNAASTGTEGVIGKPPPTAGFNVTGIMSQFCPPANGTGCTTGYQFLVRNYDDFDFGQTPNIISAISQTDFTTNSMTLAFRTENPGSTRVEYGLTPNLGTVLNDITQVTEHSITLPNLVPGSIYYVKATSTNIFGTTESPVVPFGTVSNSTGRITTYFTGSVANNYGAPGISASQLNNLVDDTLIAYINRAQESLDICIYNWNNTGLSDITAAVNAAHARGVRVRVVIDGSAANSGANTLFSAINKQVSPGGSSPAGSFYGLMHNKFVVIDADAANPNRPIVWTGSTNWTNAQINTDFNNVVIVQDQTLARTYKLEFEEMWGSTTLTPDSIFTGTSGRARFGNTKADNTPHDFIIGGKRVQCYFSPSDGTNAQIIRSINSADSAFYSANLLITRNDLAFAIRDKFLALGAGNCSYTMVDDTSTVDSRVPFSIISQAMGPRAIIETRGGPVLHHKYLIIDPHYPSLDPLVLTGSHNWSNSGEQRNDENTLIIYDYEVANEFYKEFAARLLAEGSTPCFLVTDVMKGKSVSNLWNIYPNPSQGILYVNSTSDAQVSIIDPMGRVLLSTNARKGEQKLNIKNLKQGNYVVRWQTHTTFDLKKLVVE